MAKIMVVDDNPGLVILIESILKSAGHEVIGVSSGVKAVEILKDTKPDLILLDIMMPYPDGWQTLELIRKQDDLKDVPVSMLTARRLSPEIIGTTEMRGLIDYIQKPFTNDVLIKRVSKILEDLDNIAQKKSRMGLASGLSADLKEYGSVLRLEMFRKSILAILKENLEKTDDSWEAGVIKEAIISQQRSIERLIKRRQDIEMMAWEKNTSIKSKEAV